MTRYRAYYRVSSEDQKKNQTIDSQIEHGERWCKMMGVSFDHIYMDDGISSGIPFELRPEGAKAIKDARAKKYDVLVVFDFTRYAGTSLDFLSTKQTLEVAGVQILSMTEMMPTDADDPNTNLMQTIQAGVVQWRRDKHRVAVVSGHNHWAAEGYWQGGRAPFGYRLVATSATSGGRRRSRLARHLVQPD